MSVFDWLEIAKGAKGEQFNGYKGSCSVTVGDALFGYYGGRHAHIFGPEVRTVCDIEDMLVTHGLAKLLPGLANLAKGIGGKADFCYGSNAALTYLGPKVDIVRAAEVKKIGNSLTAKGTTTDVADKSIAVTAGILSTLMLLTAAATELTLHFAYPEFGQPSQKGGTPGATEHKINGLPPQLLKALSFTITTRLMELIKQIETSTSWLEFGEQYTKSLKRLALIPATPCIIAAEAIGLLMILSVFIPRTAKVTERLCLWGIEVMEAGCKSGKYLAAV